MKKLAVLVGTLLICSAFTEFKPKVIYGDDDRRDVYQVSDKGLLEAADSTLAMIPKSRLTDTANSMVNISAKMYGQDYNLCKDEPFYDQPTGANCSAFLVADDLVATAGHCISSFECADNAFVFGYNEQAQGQHPDKVSKNEVYGCKEVIANEMTSAQDYSLVRLDRKVTGHKPLRLAKQQPKEGEGVVLIGHPAGLPTKISGGATVRQQMPEYFVTNTDSYGGNSGSAVFNAKTLEVVGILVRGENDFSYDSQKSCIRSNKCDLDGCRGEDVTHISYVIDAMNNNNQ
jgi:hypothetical protein